MRLHARGDRAPARLQGRALSERDGVILLVEDDPSTRQMLGEILSTLFPAARVLMTESGEAALELLRRSPPSVVLLDLHLDGMHGFEFAERARRATPPIHVPIVALTGDMSPDTLGRAEALGFAAFLRKPASMERLDAVLGPILDASSHG